MYIHGWSNVKLDTYWKSGSLSWKVHNPFVQAHHPASNLPRQSEQGRATGTTCNILWVSSLHHFYMSYILTIKSFRRYEARDSHRVSGVHSSSSKYSTFDAFASPESLEASPSKSHRTPTPATPPNTIYSTPRKSQQYGRSPVASKMVFSHSKQS